MRSFTRPEINIRMLVLDICEATGLQEREAVKSLCDRLNDHYINRRNSLPIYFRFGDCDQFQLEHTIAEVYLNAISDADLQWDAPVKFYGKQREVKTSIPFERLSLLLCDIRKILDGSKLDVEKTGLLDKWQYGVEFDNSRVESTNNKAIPNSKYKNTEVKFTGGGAIQNNASNSSPQGRLHVVVDNINEQVKVFNDDKEEQQYSRKDIVGKGIVTWDLLVDYAKCKGLLEGNTRADVKKRNTSVNRKNLGKNLMKAFCINESPFVKGRSGVMRFASISLASDKKNTDALERLTTAFLERHGENIPID